MSSTFRPDYKSRKEIPGGYVGAMAAIFLFRKGETIDQLMMRIANAIQFEENRLLSDHGKRRVLRPSIRIIGSNNGLRVRFTYEHIRGELA